MTKATDALKAVDAKVAPGFLGIMARECSLCRAVGEGRSDIVHAPNCPIEVLRAALERAEKVEDVLGDLVGEEFSGVDWRTRPPQWINALRVLEGEEEADAVS